MRLDTTHPFIKEQETSLLCYLPFCDLTRTSSQRPCHMVADLRRPHHSSSHHSLPLPKQTALILSNVKHHLYVSVLRLHIRPSTRGTTLSEPPV